MTSHPAHHQIALWQIKFLAFIGTVIPLAIYQSQPLTLVGTRSKFPVYVILSAAFVGSTIIKHAVQGVSPHLPRWLMVPWSLFLLAFALSFLNATDTWYALVHGGKVYLLPLLLFLSVASAENGRKSIKLLFLLLPAALIIALVGIAQFFGWLEWVSKITVIGTGGSLFYNQNLTGEFLAVTIPLFASLLPGLRKKTLRLLLLTGIILLLVCLVLTEARGAWVALLGSITVGSCFAAGAVFKKTRHQRPHKNLLNPYQQGITSFICLIPLFMICLLTSVYWANPLQTGTTMEKRNADRFITEFSSITRTQDPVRYKLWRASMEMLKDYAWLGCGAAHYGIEFPRYHPYKEDWDPATGTYGFTHNTHNDYLQVFIELGILGFLSMTTLFVVISWRAWLGFCHLFEQGETDSFFLLLGCFSGFVSFSVAMLFEFPMMMPATSFLGWLCGGLTVSLVWRQTTAPKKLNPVFRLPLAAFAMLVVAAGAAAGITSLQEHIYLGRSLQGASLRQIIGWYQKAISATPAPSEETARIQLMRIYLDHDNEEVVRIASALLARRPYFVPALWYRAHAYRGLGKDPEAAQDFVRLLNNTPFVQDKVAIRKWLFSQGKGKEILAPRRTI